MLPSLCVQVKRSKLIERETGSVWVNELGPPKRIPERSANQNPGIEESWDVEHPIVDDFERVAFEPTFSELDGVVRPRNGTCVYHPKLILRMAP